MGVCVSTMGSQEGEGVCVSTVGSVGQSDLEVGLAELDRHHLPKFTSPGLLVEGTMDHC